MSAINFEPILSRAERRAIVAVLRAHPEWTLGQVCKQLEHDAPVSAVLSKLTLGELLLSDPDPDTIERPPDGGPPLDRGRLEAARRMDGDRFDECICEVLDEAGDRPVGSAYLLARVGGPRWKLKTALHRLIANGTIERTGSTSGTRYRRASEASERSEAKRSKASEASERAPQSPANPQRKASEASERTTPQSPANHQRKASERTTPKSPANHQSKASKASEHPTPKSLANHQRKASEASDPNPSALHQHPVKDPPRGSPRTVANNVPERRPSPPRGAK